MALTVASCSDGWLDVEPSTAVETDKSINELSDVNIMLNGIYTTMQDAYAYSGRLVYYGDACGDDMMAYSSTKRTGNYYTFNFTKDTAPSTFWSYPYKMIGLCNIISSTYFKKAAVRNFPFLLLLFQLYRLLKFHWI